MVESVQNQDKFVVRLPDGMRDRIKHAAEANGRSMNAEIVGTLLEAYPPHQEAARELGLAVNIAMALMKERGIEENSQAFFDLIGEVTAMCLSDMEIEFPKHRYRDLKE